MDEWGMVTRLSRQFLISRTFIYQLASLLEAAGPQLFGPPAAFPALSEGDLAYYYILSLRMEGRCSIEAIATIMKRFNLPYSSTGSISQLLASIGSLLPDTLSSEGGVKSSGVYE